MPLSPEQQAVYVSIWEKTVDTQMHFNEMSVKARQFGLTFVAAALGLGIVMLSRGQEFSIIIPLSGGFNLNATVLIVLASAFALYAVRLLDLNVYHKMLRGSGAFGEDFEQNYMTQIFDLQKGMTQAISHFSRYQDATVVRSDGRYTCNGAKRLSAEQKIKSFYNFATVTLITVGILLFLITADFGHASSQGSARPASPPALGTKADINAK